MKTLTIKEQRARRQADLTTEVTQATRLTVDNISQMIFNHGMNYMETLGEQSIVKAFTEEPLYWAWWRQQWALVDETFLNNVKSGKLSEKLNLAHYYEHLHRQIDTFPDAVVWAHIHRSYEAMSIKVIRNHKHQQNAL